MGLVPRSDLIDNATPCDTIKIPSTSSKIRKPNFYLFIYTLILDETCTLLLMESENVNLIPFWIITGKNNKN